MNEFKQYFDYVSAEHYIPVYAVTATNNVTIVITERDIQDFIIERSQIKNINHFSFFIIEKIERKNNAIEITFKESNRSYLSESNQEREIFFYKFETNDANNFILYLNRALYRILTPDEIKSINVDECSKFVTLFPPSSSSLSLNVLSKDNHSKNTQISNSIQPFYVYSRFIEKVLLSNNNSQPIEKLISEKSLKNLRKILKYKINKINIFQDFQDCSKYFEILLIDIIPFSKYITNLIFDSTINNTGLNSIENYVNCIINCIEKSKYLNEITFVGDLPTGIEDFFTKLCEKKGISILSLTFKNAKLNQKQLSILNSSQISSYRFSGENFDSDQTLFNFIETTDIDLLSIRNSPQTDFVSNLNKFTTITVLSLCKNNIEIGDVFGFLSKNKSRIKCLYLSGNKCEKQIENDVKIPKFEEIRLDGISWGDFFLSYLQILLKTQTFVDLSNSTMNENEWNKVFNYLNTTSDGVSQLCKLLWNGNQVNKSFFSYLRKCTDSIDSLQIVDVIDQSTEKEIFDEFISFLKEGKKLTNLFIGFSKQTSKSISGNQMKSILSSLLINMKKENSKKFYLSVPNSSSGDEGVDALIDTFNNIEDCKINFISFDGLQPKNPKKYTELCDSITKYITRLKKNKDSSYAIQFPKNDLKFLKNQMQEVDYKKLRQDFRFILLSHKLDYLPSDFLYNRMILSPILKKKRFYVKNEDDELFFDDYSSNSNIFYDSLSDSNLENEKTKKNKKEKILSEEEEDEQFTSFLEYNDTNFNIISDTKNKNNDIDDEFTVSLSDDETEDENIQNKNENTNDGNKNEVNKEHDDEFNEDFIENDNNTKSEKISNDKENSIKNKNQREDESNKNSKRKSPKTNLENDNSNDESSEKNNNENNINSKNESQKEESSSSNKNDEYDEYDNMDQHSSVKNLPTNRNKDQEEFNSIKSINISQNKKYDDESDKSIEKNNEKDIKDDNENENQINENSKNKNKSDKIQDNNNESVLNKKDNKEESINSNSESQKSDHTKTTQKSTNKNTSQIPQFESEYDKEEQEQSNQQGLKQSKHSKNDINNQNGEKLNDIEYENGNKTHKSDQIQTRNNINNDNEINEHDNEYDKIDQRSSIKNLSSKSNRDQKEEIYSSINRNINQNKKYGPKSDKSIEKSNEEKTKNEHLNQKCDNKNENQLKESSKDKNKSDKISNNNNKNTINKKSNNEESIHSKITQKSTSKNASQISQLEIEYEKEEKEQKNQQESNQNKHSKSVVKHHSSNSHTIKSDSNKKRDKLNEIENKTNKSNLIQARNCINNKNDEDNKYDKASQSTTNKNLASKNPDQNYDKDSNNSKIKNSNIKYRSIPIKESFNRKNESDKTANNNIQSTKNQKENMKESTHPISKSKQHENSKTFQESKNKDTSQNSQFEYEYEEEEEQSEHLAIGQKRHSPNMIKLSLSYSNVKNRKNNQQGKSESPHLIMEYEDENGTQKRKPSQPQKNSSNKNDDDGYYYEYEYDEATQCSSVKSFTPKRNKGLISKLNRSLSPNQNRRNLSPRSNRIKRHEKASSLMSAPLSTNTSPSHKNKNKQHRLKFEKNNESDSSYDEQDSVILKNEYTNTDQNLTSNRINRKNYTQTQSFEKVKQVDLLKGVPHMNKNKNQSNCDDVLMNAQTLNASRRSSLPYKGKSSLYEVVEDRGSDIEFPEMDEITFEDQEKYWTAIGDKFSLMNIIRDIRANK